MAPPPLSCARLVEDTDTATRVEVDAVGVANVEQDVDVGVVEAFELTAKK